MSISVSFITKISIFEGRLRTIDSFDNRESDVLGSILVDLSGGTFTSVYSICHHTTKRKWESESYIE